MMRMRAIVIVFAALWLSGAVTLKAYEPCYQVCGPTVDCSQECEDYGNCGNYDGGNPQGSNGWCAGECGDDYCSAAEDFATCVQDCGYCDDGFCDLYYNPETPENCQQDCGYCGDGLCDVEGGEGSSCYDDCDQMPDNIPGPECDPTDPVDTCPYGEMCDNNVRVQLPLGQRRDLTVRARRSYVASKAAEVR